MHKQTNIHIQFLGASETVTGSKYYIEYNGQAILVDCGIFQGSKQLRELNWKSLPVDVSEIDLVLLTHGHLDHVGYLPRLVKAGFKGKIISSKPTLEIAKIVLEDGAKIQEEEAEKANKEQFSKHSPALPLYDLKDVAQTIKLFSPLALDEWHTLLPETEVRFNYNGHIIGATFIELKIANKTIVFSGDVGREEDSLLKTPHKPKKADIVFLESTYGDRIHPKDSEEQLIKIINTTIAKQGALIIPGFAVERIQLLMYVIWKLRQANKIERIPIYMDSPMGVKVLDVFLKNKEWHKIPLADFRAMCDDFTMVESIQETNELAREKGAKIIIAGSGMLSGGRVLTYLLNKISDPTCTVLFVGFQAEDTRGRKLLDGMSSIKIYGKQYEVKATIANIEGMSAHADQQELTDWLSNLAKKPEKIFIIHGEKEAAQQLQHKLKQVYNWDSEIPKLYDKIDC